MDVKSILYKCRDGYIGHVGDGIFVYNPLSEKGLAVLNKEAAFVFSLINDQRAISDIVNLVQKEDGSATLKDIQSLVGSFIDSEIVYINSPKSKSFLFDRKPTHFGVWMHITNSCNLRCTYCYVHKTPDKMSEEIALKATEKIMLSVKKHNVKKVTFKFAGGEPLLELNKVLLVIKRVRGLGVEYGIELEFVVITNGVLLSDAVCQKLKENNIRVAISLDGLGEYHDKTRVFTNGLGSFKYVEKGIANIIKHKIPFNVSITITQKNIENIPELTAYLLNKQIPFAFNFYRENPFVHEALEGDDKKLVEYLKKAYKLIRENPPRHSVINGILDRVSFKRPHLYACAMGLNYIVVRHDGKLISCQMTQDKVIGSIADDDLIITMLKGNFIEPTGLTVEGKKGCRECQWKYICCGGCPLLSKEQKGTFDTNSPYCSVYKELIPEALRIEASRLIKYGSNGSKSLKQDIQSPYLS